MQCNVGKTDRTIRIVVGIAILAIGVGYLGSWWGLLGLVPLSTGLVRWCPPYQLLGINTNKTQN